MPLSITLTEKVSDGLWKATGTASGLDKDKNQREGAAEILVKDTPDGLVPHLDSRIMVSKIFGREVISYANPDPVQVAKPKKGVSVIFRQVQTTLKKQNSK